MTKDESLQAALLSPEFFDAERYPTVSFSGTATRAEGAQVEFKGEITIKGVAQPTTRTVTLTGRRFAERRFCCLGSHFESEPLSGDGVRAAVAEGSSERRANREEPLPGTVDRAR